MLGVYTGKAFTHQKIIKERVSKNFWASQSYPIIYSDEWNLNLFNLFCMRCLTLFYMWHLILAKIILNFAIYYTTISFSSWITLALYNFLSLLSSILFRQYEKYTSPCGLIKPNMPFPQFYKVRPNKLLLWFWFW